MRIGIDFDNTIACYDGVFHQAAVERKLIPPDIPTDKTSVRNHLRSRGCDADFTELQGYVYGTRMDLVSLYPGFVGVLRKAASAGQKLFIVSHKTKTPFAGTAYDLHKSARDFLVAQRVVGDGGDLVRAGNVFFELTKEDKIARIAALRCDVFIDDLPELLAMDGFPKGIRRILFDPDAHYTSGGGGEPFERYTSWREIGEALLVL
jgi:hypothetical protein